VNEQKQFEYWAGIAARELLICRQIIAALLLEEGL